jgi:hypothetical protein
MRPLDPVVTAISPAHDAKEIASTAPVVIHFSQPMDASSVEHAFSIDPPVRGTFSWSATRDEMTFKPDAPGFQAGTVATIRIGAAARADNGNKFYAGFEARYRCAVGLLK